MLLGDRFFQVLGIDWSTCSTLLRGKRSNPGQFNMVAHLHCARRKDHCAHTDLLHSGKQNFTTLFLPKFGKVWKPFVCVLVFSILVVCTLTSLLCVSPSLPPTAYLLLIFFILFLIYFFITIILLLNYYYGYYYILGYTTTINNIYLYC